MKKSSYDTISLLDWWPICGIIAPILYILADAITAAHYKGYSYINQSISELSAIGAPTSTMWKTITIPFSPLIIAFGLGMLLKLRGKVSLRITGMLLFLWGLSGYAWLFFPMNVRGKIGSASDTGHLILAGFTVLLLVLMIISGSGARGKGFRIYSIVSVIVMLGFGAVVGSQAPNVAAQLPTPYMGIFERISVFIPMIWLLALAIQFLAAHKEARL